jgi:hypothetical protein
LRHLKSAAGKPPSKMSRKIPRYVVSYPRKKKTHTHTLHPNFPMFNLLALIDNPTGLKKMSELSGIEI